MSDLRIITPKSGYFTFCLRQEYVEICGGNHCAAMVLSQHEYWHKNRIANRQQANSRNAGARRGGMPADQDASLWVYKSHEQMQDELMGLFGEKAIGQAYRHLMTAGFLTSRFNPSQKWDRKPQYLFLVANVQTAVDALPNKGVEQEEDISAESSPQKCGDDGANKRDGQSAVAESKAQECGVSKERPSENKNKKINQSLAAVAAPELLPSVLPEQKGPEQKEPERPSLRRRAQGQVFKRVKHAPPCAAVLEQMIQARMAEIQAEDAAKEIVNAKSL